MKILVTGRGSAGSWQIRGEQLGSAIGATVIPNATTEQQQGYDVTICVKKPPKEWKPSGIVVWDMVDPWPQPSGNEWTKRQLIDFVADQKQRIGAHYSVAATQQMQYDTRAELCLPHHSRPGIERNPIRKEVDIVGYEGDPRFLGRWYDLLIDACLERGWMFTISPAPLASWDIVVALRDHPYRGIATAHWKSNVKLANAQASGTPILCLPEAGYIETESGGEKYIALFEALPAALDSLSPYEERLKRSNLLLQKSFEYKLPVIAKEYREWIESLF
jgi:hypothetical protein